MNFHQRIKAATQPDHDRTEQLLTRPIHEFTLADYRQFLQTNWVFHASLERALTHSLPSDLQTQLQWSERRKADRLAADLRTLDAAPTNLTLLPFAIAGVPEALGAMYVAEGSTLGGMMIKKTLQNNAEVSAHTSFAFLGCYGPQTGSRWRSFLAVLEEYLNSPTDEAIAIASAQSTFGFFETCHRYVAQPLVRAF